MRAAAVAAAFAVVAAGCYQKHPWRSNGTTTMLGERRLASWGEVARLVAGVDADGVVATEAALALCREQEQTTQVDLFTRRERRRELLGALGWFLILPVVWLFTSPEFPDGERAVERGTSWADAGAPRPCPGALERPVVGRSLHLEACFASGACSTTDAMTDEHGTAHFPELAQMSAASAYCGAMTVTVSDDTPGLAAPPEPTTFELPAAALAASPARLDGALAVTARACCAAAETDRARLSCEESCAVQAGIDDCLLARRDCLLDAFDDAARGRCDNAWRACATDHDGSAGEHARCVEACVERTLAEDCP